jgi:clan AA aspartic protease (TIGR02281 family)
MDFIRDTKEFKALVKKYSEKTKRGDKNVAIGVFNVVEPDKVTISEIPFTKENGVCKVKCSVNGLPLHFVFDTGASDVTISMVEATFMMKNGYLSGNDVVGSQRYMDANGDVTVGTVVNLRNVNFGGLDLDNVKASVVRNQKAPLLLGQSVLGRLGKIEIDNSKNVLKISKNKY